MSLYTKHALLSKLYTITLKWTPETINVMLMYIFDLGNELTLNVMLMYILGNDLGNELTINIMLMYIFDLGNEWTNTL